MLERFDFGELADVTPTGGKVWKPGFHLICATCTHLFGGEEGTSDW
jgi:hypothetical protein